MLPIHCSHYRCHQIEQFRIASQYGEAIHAGRIRFQGEPRAYCEARSEFDLQQHCLHIIDLHFARRPRLSLRQLPRPVLAYAITQICQQPAAGEHTDGNAYDEREQYRAVFRAHMFGVGTIPHLQAQQKARLTANSSDWLLAHARASRALFDYLDARPPEGDARRDPYLSALVQTSTTRFASVVRLQPEVYWALSLVSLGHITRDGHRTAQDLPGSA